MDCSMPGFPVFHCLPEFAQVHVHWVGNAVQPSHPLPSSSFALIFPSIRVFFNESALCRSFLNSPVGKEPTCSAGDPCSIPGSERSPGEGVGFPLQYSWASLVAQLVKNLPATWETWVWSLGWEDPLEKGTATHASILAWRIPWTVKSMGSQRIRHSWLSLHFT